MTPASAPVQVSLDVGGVTVTTTFFPGEPLEHAIDRLVLALRQHGIDARREGRAIIGGDGRRLA